MLVSGVPAVEWHSAALPCCALLSQRLCFAFLQVWWPGPDARQLNAHSFKSHSPRCCSACPFAPLFAPAGRNIAEVAARLGVAPVALVTSLGDDWAAKGIAQHCAGQLGVHVLTVHAEAASAASAASATPALSSSSTAPQLSPAAARTPVYSALLDEAGELVAAVADMDAFDALTPAAVLHAPLRRAAAAPPSPAAAAAAAAAASTAMSQASSFGDMLRACQTYRHSSTSSSPSGSSSLPAADSEASGGAATPVVVLDANVPAETLRAVCDAAAAGLLLSNAGTAGSAASAASAAAAARSGPAAGAIPVLFEPISVAKSVRIVDADALHAVTLIKPNRHEAIALAARIRAAMGLPADADADAAEPAGDAANAAAGDDGSVPTELDSASVRKVFLPDAATGKLVDAATETVITDPHGRQSRVVEGPPSEATATAAAKSAGAGAAASSGRAKWADVAQGLAPLTGPQAAADSAVAAALAPSNEDGDAANSAVNYGLLTAAQTILSSMVRPGPLAGHSSAQQVAPVLAAAIRGGAIAALEEVKVQIAREVERERASNSSAASGGLALPSDSDDSEVEHATVDGRKHVLVTVGAEGVLWLSAPPTPSHHIADLMASLPFFMAAAHPALELDFKLVPAAAVDRVAKVTGAGDSFAGAVVASLARGCSGGMETAVRHGLAAAKLAIETEPGAASQSTISPCLSWNTVVQAAASSVPQISNE